MLDYRPLIVLQKHHRILSRLHPIQKEKSNRISRLSRMMEQCAKENEQLSAALNTHEDSDESTAEHSQTSPRIRESKHVPPQEPSTEEVSAEKKVPAEKAPRKTKRASARIQVQ